MSNSDIFSGSVEASLLIFHIVRVEVRRLLCVCDNMNHTAKLMKPSGLIAVLDNLSLFKAQKDHFQLFTPYENVRLYTAADHRD